MIGKKGDSAVHVKSCPGCGSDQCAIGGASIAEGGDVKVNTAAIEADELHAFEPEMLDVIHDMTVLVTGGMNREGGQVDRSLAVGEDCNEGRHPSVFNMMIGVGGALERTVGEAGHLASPFDKD